MAMQTGTVRWVIGGIAFIFALFSFTMTYYSFTPAFLTLRTQTNASMATRDLPAGVQTIWDRTVAIYGLSWSAWGFLGIIFLVIWYLVFVNKVDPWSTMGGYYRATPAGNSAGSPTIARASLTDLSQLGGLPGAMALQELIAVAFGLFILTILWFIFNVARLDVLASLSGAYATEMQDPGVLVLSNFWAIIIPVSLVILVMAVLIDMQRKRRMAIGRI